MKQWVHSWGLFSSLINAMSHSLPFNDTNFNTQSHSSARFPLIHSNWFLECCSCINLLKQRMILFGCDLQASQKQWKASSFRMKYKHYPTEHIPLSQKVILFKTLVLCFLLLVWFLVGFFGLCFPLGVVFLFHCMSLLCRSTTLTDEYVPPEFLTYSHAKDNSLLGHAKWDCVLNQHAAAVWGWPEARGWLPCIDWKWVQLLGKH